MHELVTANAEQWGVPIFAGQIPKKKSKCQWPPVPSLPFVVGVVSFVPMGPGVGVRLHGGVMVENTRGKLCRRRAND